MYGSRFELYQRIIYKSPVSMYVRDELRNYWNDFYQILQLSVIWSNLRDRIVLFKLLTLIYLLLQIKCL